MQLEKIHHIAIICKDYRVSKNFYTQILGLEILQEVYREARDSYKLDLGLNKNYVIELFSFPNPPKRTSKPEAAGLRHLAFAVKDIEAWKKYLEENDIVVEPIRTDPYTDKKFTFFEDPDQLPLELYEV